MGRIMQDFLKEISAKYLHLGVQFAEQSTSLEKQLIAGLVVSLLLNLWLHFKRPHRHFKVKEHPQVKGVYTHKFKTRRN